MKNFLNISIALISIGGLASAPVESSLAQPVDDSRSVETIAVIDTGVFPAAQGSNITNYDARVPNNIKLVSEDEKWRWNSRHGTWIASIIRDRKADVKIISYRVDIDCPVPDACNMSTLSIYKSALHAEKLGAKVIVIPSAGSMGEYAEDKFAEIANRGVHIIFPAGNEGKTSKMLRLSSLNKDFIHVVGSVNDIGRKSSFSDHDSGENLFRWVKGEDIKASDPDGKRRSINGTSYAAAAFAANLSF